MSGRATRGGRLGSLVASLALLAGLLAAAPASAEFGLNNFDVIFSEPDATPGTFLDDLPAIQAGSHPFAMTTSFGVNYTGAGNKAVVDGQVKDLLVEQIPGLVGDATAVPRCSTIDFVSILPGTALPRCADETAVGILSANLINAAPISFNFNAPVYNLEPPPGVAVTLGFNVLNVKVAIDVGLKPDGDYNVVARQSNTPQPLSLFGAALQLWGVPSDPAHDPIRGHCVGSDFEAASIGKIDFTVGSNASCASSAPAKPFLTLPRSCQGPLASAYEVNSWTDPASWLHGSTLTHDAAVPPNPTGFLGCAKLGFSPTIAAQPSADSAESATGLDFSLEFRDEGLTSPEGLGQSQIEKARVTLPEGVTVNPSIGEGLGVCTPTDLERETLAAAPGAGCPNASKIGTVEVQTPLLGEALPGSLFLAPQDDPRTATPGAENPFDSLLALYIVVKDPGQGILVKLPAKVEPDPQTGQLITTVEDVPQLPFSRFSLRFREGQRAPLVSPPACGQYTTVAELTPSADPTQTVVATSSFQIAQGIGGDPCPPGGVPPFKPGFEAGSLNNNAKAFSPFAMRLTRSDGEQDMTKLSSVLPPGVLGKLAGVGKCPEAAIEAAKARTGREELAAPSCPPSAQIGRTQAGAGVGGALTYVGGSLYLAGPYKGAPLSVVSITPAVAGPFDAGTVVVRLGLDLDPVTAQVEVDGASSDPIPHILKGIPLKVRDLQVYVDRPNFVINPTSCDPSSVEATLFGSYLDLFSPLDDVAVALSSRYQAANCLNLGFKPSLKLSLKGGTKRGDHPGLRAVLRPRPGDANIAAARVTLPRSAFLEQSHIRTICTRVQFAAENCPEGSVYGHARAITPLLEEPVEGPVILRSSDNKLPDLVLALKGLIDVDVSSRIDSFKGGIRNTFEVVPDAPVTRFVLTLQGGRKGLIVNSRDLCEGKVSRVNARFTGQNGKIASLRPQLRPQCGGKRKR